MQLLQTLWDATKIILLNLFASVLIKVGTGFGYCMKGCRWLAIKSIAQTDKIIERNWELDEIRREQGIKPLDVDSLLRK